MKRIYRSILLLAAALPAAFPAEAREIIDINRNWRFTLDDDRTYGEPAFDDSGWQRLDLPHDWSIAGAYDKRNPSGPQGGFMPCGTGWYRHSFEAPAGSEGNRVFVRFDGVYMKSQVWINGRMVGEYPNGYNSFEYDITPFVRRDTLNVLAVRVDNSLQPGSRWYTGSGIYRNVHLIVTSQMHFTDGGLRKFRRNGPESKSTTTSSTTTTLRRGLPGPTISRCTSGCATATPTPRRKPTPTTGCRRNARSLRSFTTQTARK